MARHGYRGDGAYGQFCVILPEHDVVLALTAATEDMQAVLDAAWTHLLPAFGDAGEGEAADAALADRLTGLQLPPSDAGASAPSGSAPQTWSGSGLSATRTDDGVVLSDPQVSLALPIGLPGWTVVEGDGAAPPVAVSGGWHGDTARLDLAFLESPHRLRVDLEPSGGITTRWATTPLDFAYTGTILGQWAPRPLA
jgi:hypothetical protein